MTPDRLKQIHEATLVGTRIRSSTVREMLDEIAARGDRIKKLEGALRSVSRQARKHGHDFIADTADLALGDTP